MDTLSMTSAALSSASTSQDVQTLVLKKAQDQAQSSTLKLLEALPQVSPPHLGNSIDVRA